MPSTLRRRVGGRAVLAVLAVLAFCHDASTAWVTGRAPTAGRPGAGRAGGQPLAQLKRPFA